MESVDIVVGLLLVVLRVVVEVCVVELGEWIYNAIFHSRVRLALFLVSLVKGYDLVLAV